MSVRQIVQYIDIVESEIGEGNFDKADWSVDAGQYNEIVSKEDEVIVIGTSKYKWFKENFRFKFRYIPDEDLYTVQLSMAMGRNDNPPLMPLPVHLRPQQHKKPGF